MASTSSVTRRTLADTEPLKALAHPLRMDLYEVLVVDGPLTATELAERLGQSPSNCSWHLRKLAEHGFVSEVPDVPGRSRPWQAIRQALSWDEAAAEPALRAAGLALSETLLQRETRLLMAAHEAAHLEPQEWQGAGTVVQSATWLTAQETREISARLEELLTPYLERLHDPAARPEGSRLMSLVGWVAPRQAPGSER